MIDEASRLALAEKIEQLGFVGSDDLTIKEMEVIVATLRSTPPLSVCTPAQEVVAVGCAMCANGKHDSSISSIIISYSSFYFA